MQSEEKKTYPYIAVQIHELEEELAECKHRLAAQCSLTHPPTKLTRWATHHLACREVKQKTALIYVICHLDIYPIGCFLHFA